MTYPVVDSIRVLDDAVAAAFGEPQLAPLPRHDARQKTHLSSSLWDEHKLRVPTTKT